MAMDVDGGDEVQQPRQVPDYGITVNFDDVDEDEELGEGVARLDREINEKNAEIERMVPNLKALERFVFWYRPCPLH